ncbi:MAG TPA: DUF4952 domain-containing protein [Cyanobacteria bacterium UBA11149]|nr:DUF4952 domain-containing protein [Cyanobacteria bacterium UBA11366]HBR72253.1 DUF4952 domain-containing protein [Cyanobacteria bacterium UBA11159]HBS68425.1 DUF4952 domain-containing protein [Cyanobacteria bacterium UBA11153]HBW91915.1 DUF4952 domain-containing protein [Cyanobacteria bacterium UBA11149]HCA94486.1 DUF4952 domain-containing protein [Cyanobacteria bacterium UBA9226]
MNKVLGMVLITAFIGGFVLIFIGCNLINPACEDFLAKLGNKPEELEFAGCKKYKKFSLEALEARYKVTGKDAPKVERFLQQKFQMSELRFLCCGWEPVRRIENTNSPGYGSFRDSRGYEYEVSMFSQETLIDERQDWQNIPFLYVDVTLYLEQP